MPRNNTSSSSSSIDVSEQAGVRYLHFGSEWIQGAMRVARPWKLELDYTRVMMAPLLLVPEPAWPRRVLIVGLGAGSLVKFLYRHRPQARLDVVEIDPQVVACARQHFKLPEDAGRIAIEIGDGARHVATGGEPYDLVLVDGFDARARAGALETSAFYAACRARLAADGLLVANLLSENRGYRASLERLRTAFDGRVLALPSRDAGNMICVAAAGSPVHATIAELKQAARALKDETGLDLLALASRIEQSGSCPGGVLRL